MTVASSPISGLRQIAWGLVLAEASAVADDDGVCFALGTVERSTGRAT
jgi:hypothetical protein